MAEEWWEAFAFRFGPFEFGVSGLGHIMTHTRTETTLISNTFFTVWHFFLPL
jgi:hypothetical protein